MAKERILSYSASQCLAYVALTDFPSFGNPRTVTQASNLLGKRNHSTISSEVQKHLLPEGIIRKKHSKQRTDVIYVPGRNRFFIEKDIEKFVELFKSQTIKPDDRIGVSDSDLVGCERIGIEDVGLIEILKYAAGLNAKLPPFNQYRYHINGAGFIFDVERQGTLDTILVNGDGKKIAVALFGDSEPDTRFKGCHQWQETYVVPGIGGFHLEYQHWLKSGVKILKVHPPEFIGPYLEGWTDEDILKMFMERTAMVLDQMRDGGGWRFATNPKSPIGYAFHIPKDSTRDSSDPGRVNVEYGFDTRSTEILHDTLGEYGFPGKTRDWYDRSKKALGDGEFETSDISVVDAWEHLPDTTKMARESTEILIDHEERITEQETVSGTLLGKQSDHEIRLRALEDNADRTLCVLEKIGRNQDRAARSVIAIQENIGSVTSCVDRLTCNFSRALESGSFQAEA